MAVFTGFQQQRPDFPGGRSGLLFARRFRSEKRLSPSPAGISYRKEGCVRQEMQAAVMVSVATEGGLGDLGNMRPPSSASALRMTVKSG